jgi:hypothetical protein
MIASGSDLEESPPLSGGQRLHFRSTRPLAATRARAGSILGPSAASVGGCGLIGARPLRGGQEEAAVDDGVDAIVALPALAGVVTEAVLAKTTRASDATVPTPKILLIPIQLSFFRTASVERQRSIYRRA